MGSGVGFWLTRLGEFLVDAIGGKVSGLRDRKWSFRSARPEMYHMVSVAGRGGFG